MAKEQTKATATDINEFESNLIRCKAASLARRGLLPRAEVEDVQQELALALLIAKSKVKLDPKRRDGFAATIVRNAASNVVRDRFADKRHPAHVCSLNALLAKCEDLLDLIAIEPATQPTQELQLDTKELIAKLPEELQALAEELKTKSVSALAKELGIPRSTLSSRLRAIRNLLEKPDSKNFV